MHQHLSASMEISISRVIFLYMAVKLYCLSRGLLERNMAVKVLFNILGGFHYHINKNGNFQKKRDFLTLHSQHTKWCLHLFPSHKPLSISSKKKWLYRTVTLILCDLAWHKWLHFSSISKTTEPSTSPFKKELHISIFQNTAGYISKV